MRVSPALPPAIASERFSGCSLGTPACPAMFAGMSAWLLPFTARMLFPTRTRKAVLSPSLSIRSLLRWPSYFPSVQTPPTKFISTCGSGTLSGSNRLEPLADELRPAFNEPWQAEAYALVQVLIETGRISSSQWAKAFGAALREAVGQGEPDSSRVSRLLALEISPSGRQAADRPGRALIRRMSQENPLWGAPRIHGELLKLGFAVSQSTVAKYVARTSNPPSQSWRTFVRNHAPPIAAMDLFVVPTIGFNLLYALVMVRLARRELVWINVTAHPTAEWIAQQITEASRADASHAWLVSRIRCACPRHRRLTPPGALSFLVSLEFCGPNRHFRSDRGAASVPSALSRKRPPNPIDRRRR